MKKITRFSIIGSIISILLIIFKTDHTSKTLASVALVIFIVMFISTRQKNKKMA